MPWQLAFCLRQTNGPVGLSDHRDRDHERLRSCTATTAVCRNGRRLGLLGHDLRGGEEPAQEEATKASPTATSQLITCAPSARREQGVRDPTPACENDPVDPDRGHSDESTDTGRSVTCNGVVMSVNGTRTSSAIDHCKSSDHGMATTNGARVKTILSAAVGEVLLNISFMPSAKDCSNPNGPFILGPLRCCMKATTRRSYQMARASVPAGLRMRTVP